MRILVLAPQPFFVQRGTPIAVRTVLQTLAAEGHELDVVVYAEGEDIDIPNCTIVRVPRLPGTSGVGPGFTIKKLVCDAAMGPLAAWRIVTRHYDAIHAVEEAAFIALVLGAVSGLPYIYDMDSSLPQQIVEKFRVWGWVEGLLVAAERLALRRSAGVLTCCPALETIARGHAAHVLVRTVEDTSLLGSALTDDAPDDCNFPEPIVMYIGNLEPYQGVGLLIDGFARVSTNPPARLVIVGGNDAHISEYRSRAHRLGVSSRVTFLGPRPLQDLGRYLRQATVVVSPRTQGINTPMKVYSYLDSGRPLLATRLPTHTQVIDDRTAMLVTPSPEGIADGLQRLLLDPALCEQLAAAAREEVSRRFSPAASARKLREFYRALEFTPGRRLRARDRRAER